MSRRTPAQVAFERILDAMLSDVPPNLRDNYLTTLASDVAKVRKALEPKKEQ